MDWVSPLSALLGAVVGAGSTLLAQRGLWRQQVRQQDREARRQSYSAFLTALHEAGEGLWVLASGVRDPEPDALLQAAYDACPAAALSAMRAQILITAPDPVAEAVKESYDAMRLMRDCVGHGRLAGSAEHDAAIDSVNRSWERLREVMRADLTIRP